MLAQPIAHQKNHAEPIGEKNKNRKMPKPAQRNNGPSLITHPRLKSNTQVKPTEASDYLSARPQMSFVRKNIETTARKVQNSNLREKNCLHFGEILSGIQFSSA